MRTNIALDVSLQSVAQVSLAEFLEHHPIKSNFKVQSFELIAKKWPQKKIAPSGIANV